MPLYVSEEHLEIRLDADGEEERGYRLGGSEPYEAFTDDVGRLFRDCQREYGRCTGKVYIDRKDGSPMAIGWVFRKQRAYEDSPRQFYVHEVWVMLHDALSAHEVTHYYHSIGEDK